MRRTDTDSEGAGPGHLESLRLGAILVAAALVAVLIVSRIVAYGITNTFDTWLLTALRTPGDLADPIGPPWFEEVMRDFTALGGNGVLTLVVATAAGFFLLTQRPRTAIVFLAAVLTGLGANHLLKYGIDRPRPELVAHGAHVYTRSYPSSHATMAAIVYLTLGALWARSQPGRGARIHIVSVAILVAGLVGISRVYLGVHWPTDVLAGWMMGALWALASLIALAATARR